MRKLKIVTTSTLLLCGLGLYALGTVAASNQAEKEDSLVAKIYFVKFIVVTDAPITMDNIEKQNDDIFFLVTMHRRPPELVANLKALLESTPQAGQISKLEIRLKVELVKEGNTYYADRNGIVLKNGTETYRLTGEQMKEVESLLKPLSGVVDIKASKKMSLSK